MKKSSSSIEQINAKYYLTEVENFVWLTADGEEWRPNYMTTERLVAALIAVFNSCAPRKVHLVCPGLGYIPKSWSPRYKRAAVVSTIRELRKRVLDASDYDRVRHMQRATAAMWPNYAGLLPR